MDLKKVRKEIDLIDNKILDLLKKRLLIVKKIGVWKSKNGMKVRDAKREGEMLSLLTEKANKKGLDGNFVVSLWKLILKNSRKNQEVIKK